MLVAAAVCPHPPVLVPEAAAGAAPELAALRTGCAAVLDRVVAAHPDLVVLVGAGEPPGERSGDAWGTLAPYGVTVSAGLNARRPGQPTLPLSLTVGAWLLSRAPWHGQVTACAVSDATRTDACAELGAALARRAARVGMVALGDGSARRSLSGPGYLDSRAEVFDRSVAQALRLGDPDLLLGLDADLAADLMAAGRAPWQVLAGAARGGSWRGEVLCDEAPYGVGYLVASWTRAA